MDQSMVKMYQSLDQIIASRPKGRRGTGRRNTARTQILGAPITSPSTRARQAVAAAAIVAKASPRVSQPTEKIIVSNLPEDVNEIQIKELFHSTVGPLREVTLHYDSAGRSKGVASVHFQRKGDGSKAYMEYNNRLIDGS
jgi:THO complex subunit 4